MLCEGVQYRRTSPAGKDVETVLRTAAREVRQALNLPEVVVRLSAHPSDKVNIAAEEKSV